MTMLSSEDREIVEELAEAILKVVGDRKGWRPHVDQAMELVWKQQKKHRPSQEVSHQARFKADNNLMTWDDYATKYGLHTTEREAARDILQTMRYGEKGALYFKDQPPTEAQLYEIANQTYMYKWDACAYLGISEHDFVKYKREFGIVHQREAPMGVNESGIYNAYLYSKADIDLMADLIAHYDDDLFQGLMRHLGDDEE